MDTYVYIIYNNSLYDKIQLLSWKFNIIISAQTKDKMDECYNQYYRGALALPALSLDIIISFV